MSKFGDLFHRALSSLVGLADRAPLRFALASVSVLMGVAIAVFPPSYETCDDVLMTMIASGKGIAPAPDAHLVFTNVAIGQALQSLYKAYPDVPWYGCYLLLVHFAAQTAMLYCALLIGRCVGPDNQGADRAANDRFTLHWRLGLFLAYFCLAELPLLNRFQFTTTAFVASQAGIFLMLLAWRRRTQAADAPVLGPLCAAAALLVVGGMVRLESLAMAALVAAPAAAFFLKDFSRRALVPCGLAATAAVALLGGAVAYDHAAYEHDPSWRGYRSLNQLRGKFHDGSWTYYSAETAPIFARAGWSENDHAMIARWYSDDAELYGQDKLASIVAAYPWQSSRNMTGLWRHAFRDIARNRYVLALLLALPFALLVVHVERSSRQAILVSLATAVVLIACVIWIKKVPPQRVFLPLMSFPLAAALLSFAWRRDERPAAADSRLRDRRASASIGALWQRQAVSHRVATVLLVVAIVMSGLRQLRQSSLVQHDRLALQGFLHDVRTGGRKLYVSWEAALPYELYSPFDALNSWSGVPLLSLAWPQRTPCHEAIKRQFGISNLARALYERGDIVLIATDEHRDLFAKFAQEHFGDEVSFVPSRQTGSKFVAGTLRLKTPASAAVRPIDAKTR
jgi:hypothetical protein